MGTDKEYLGDNMNFFTADSHFSLLDETIIPRDFRPFESLEEMNNKIIEIWNEQAGSGEIIYHLGDFVNYNGIDYAKYKDYFELVKKINAKVVLILGNNEKKILRNEFAGDFQKMKEFLLEIGFHDVKEDYLEIDIGGNLYFLTHRPTDSNKESKFNLFGHIHKCGFIKKFGFNVGVDNHYFRLFSESDIVELESRRKYFDDDVYC